MARVRHVQKAQASTKTRNCRRCGTPIVAGQPYKYVKKRSGPRGGFTIFYCGQHSPKPSELASGRTADLLSMTEGFDETMTANSKTEDPTERIQNLSSDLESFISEIESFGEEIQNGADNIEDGFGHSTAQSEAMAETAEAFTEWAEEVRRVQEEIDERLRSVEDDDEDDEDSGPLTEEQADDLWSQAEEALAQEPDLNLQG